MRSGNRGRREFKTGPARIEVCRDPRPELTRCRGEECGALIEWVVTRKGRRMPITAPIVPLEAYQTLDGRTWVAIDAASSHFVTCPAAAAYRRRQEAGEP